MRAGLGNAERSRPTRGRITKLTSDVAELATAVAEKKDAYEAAQSKLASEKKRLQATDKKVSCHASSLGRSLNLSAQINKLTAERDAAAKQIDECQLEQKKVAHKIQRCHSDEKDARDKVAKMGVQYPWIAEEKAFFGKPHSGYDFANQASGCTRRVRQLRVVARVRCRF
jgi:structural maintenance of chromosome 2